MARFAPVEPARKDGLMQAEAPINFGQRLASSIGVDLDHGFEQVDARLSGRATQPVKRQC